MNLEILLILTPTFPLLSFPLSLFLGKRTPGQGAVFGILSSLASLITSTYLFFFAGKPISFEKEWIPGFTSGLYLDELSSVMLMIVSGISLLVNVYSLGYMHGEEGLPRYYGELSLFTGSMLTLVLAKDFLILFVSWELVGLCSYLLIGFWYKREEVAKAAKKAFVVTRFGDSFMLLGIILMYVSNGTLDLVEINSHAREMSSLLIALLLFSGAIGKSAQVPLLGWLWDAMEGPTTVSCLIHSATMVKAGVYLVARLFPYFSESGALPVVAYFGAFTAMVSATMALVEWDIKRVLAFSTISQLGYMFLALGVGSYESSISHLISHSSFKALLFLGAGSVIHAVGSRDMRSMGGLLKAMPITSTGMLIGVLSLSGIPPFSGYFSKEAVMHSVMENGDILLYSIGTLTAFLTAFYSLRMWILTFLGPTKKEIKESPSVMTLPMIVLMVSTATLGLFIHSGGGTPYPLLLAITGLILSYRYHNAFLRAGPLSTLLSKRYFLDELYDLIGNCFFSAGKALDLLDRQGIDGTVNWISSSTLNIGDKLRRLQTGEIQLYLLLIVIGALVLLIMTW